MMREVDGTRGATDPAAHVRALSRPRRTGTEGELAARRYIAGHLRQLGYEVEEEEFSATARAAGLLRIYGLALASALILCATAPADLFPMCETSAVAALAMFLSIPRFLRWACHSSLQPREKGEPRTGLRGEKNLLRSANIVAHLPGSTPDARYTVMLVAHYDSKSQNMPLLRRMALTAVALVSGVSLAVLTLIRGTLYHSAATPQLTLVIPLLLICAMAALALLLTIRSGNASPGAIDNAAGVAALLHVAARLARSDRSRDGSAVTFLFTGAEEEGLLGAWAYLARHGEGLRQSKGSISIINLDGVGVGKRLALIGGDVSHLRHPSRMTAAVTQAARRVGMPLWRIGRLPGVPQDHVPFAAVGLDAVTISGISRNLSRVHLARDGADAVNPAALEAVAELIWQVASGSGRDGVRPTAYRPEPERVISASGGGDL